MAGKANIFYKTVISNAFANAIYDHKKRMSQKGVTILWKEIKVMAIFKSKYTAVHEIDGRKYKITDSFSGIYLLSLRKNGKWISISGTKGKGKKIFDEIWKERKGYAELGRKWY